MTQMTQMSQINTNFSSCYYFFQISLGDFSKCKGLIFLL